MSKQISTFLFSLIYFHTHWTICLIIYAMSILIQSIHTRKIKRFAFACPRETFSNRVFFSIYYFFFFYHKITNHISKRNSLERKKKSRENFYLFFFQRKLLPDWMEQWQVGGRQPSLAPYHKLYRKSRFRFSRTPIVAPVNIHRKGLRTTCCAPVTKREARIRVR